MELANSVTRPIHGWARRFFATDYADGTDGVRVYRAVHCETHFQTLHSWTFVRIRAFVVPFFEAADGGLSLTTNYTNAHEWEPVSHGEHAIYPDVHS